MDVEPTNLEPTNSVSADDAKKNKKDRRVKKTKYTPEGESEVDRDRRTVFVGNVGVEILKSKVSGRPFSMPLSQTPGQLTLSQCPTVFAPPPLVPTKPTQSPPPLLRPNGLHRIHPIPIHRFCRSHDTARRSSRHC
jgi:hypothetical protein